jgi:polysaccharide biosynthesis/export protein
MRRWATAFASALTSALILTALLVTPSGFDAAAQDGGRAPARQADPTRRNLDSYRLAVGDEIDVTVYQPGELKTVLQQRLSVPANGMVSMPPIGKVDLLGKTAFEVEEIVSLRLKEENFLTSPNVGCIVVKYAPRRVSVIGAVRASLDLDVHRDMRILELLSRINSLDAEGADFSSVEIRRVAPDGRPFRFTVNVEAAFEQNDEQQNIVIKEGDIVRIPRLESATPHTADFVYVLGKVASRGRIPIVRGRTPFTLVKLIAICGDFTEFADRSKVKVIRVTETGRSIIPLDFDDIMENKRPDFELRPDDVIFVPESFL